MTNIRKKYIIQPKLINIINYSVSISMIFIRWPFWLTDYSFIDTNKCQSIILFNDIHSMIFIRWRHPWCHCVYWPSWCQSFNAIQYSFWYSAIWFEYSIFIDWLFIHSLKNDILFVYAFNETILQIFSVNLEKPNLQSRKYSIHPKISIFNIQCNQ